MGQFLGRVAARRYPSPNRHDDGGTLRLIMRRKKFPEMLRSSFETVYAACVNQPFVQRHTLEVLAWIVGRVETLEDIRVAENVAGLFTYPAGSTPIAG